MKLKGINAFEQHVEKIVLVVLGVAALGVVASQFVFQSNQIKVGQVTVSPDKAYEPVQQAAEQLRSKVAAKDPELPTPPKTDVLDRFQKSLAGPVTPRPTLTALGPGNVLGGEGGPGRLPVGDGTYAALVVPAPGLPVARMYGLTVDPFEVIAAPEIKEVLPAEQPFDLFAVTVETQFDGTALEKALQNDPEGDAEQIPQGWWQNGMEILAVELERERLETTGQWTAATALGAIPGRLNLVSEVAKKVKSQGDLPAIVETARQRPREVQRPEFYGSIAGRWQPPTEVEEGKTPAELIDEKQKKVNTLETEIERLRKRQQALANEGQREERAERPTGKGAAGGGHGGGGGGRGQPAQPAPEPRGTKSQPKGETQLARQLRRAEEERDRLVEEIKVLQDKLSNPTGTERTELALPLLRNPKVRLWAHDVKAEPGAVYRYRVRVVVNNPFFGKEASLTGEQKALAAEPLVRGEWSDWTDAVTVVNKQYYFITQGFEQDGIGGGDRASAELMQFYYGYFRRAKLTAQTGDMLVAEAKLPTELKIFDMQRLAAGERPKTEEPVPAADPGEGGRKGVNQVQPGQEPEAAKVEDDVAKPAPQKLPMAFDAVLLDVAGVPAVGGMRPTASKVFLREGQGTIVTRLPEQTAIDPIYQQLDRSVRLGESQGRPRVMARVPKPELDLGPERRGEDPKRHKGHGEEGGGGGGG